MPHLCTVCRHAERDAIDAALVAGNTSNRRIASQHRLSEAAVRRHKAAHLQVARGRVVRAKPPSVPTKVSGLRSPAEEAMVAAWLAQQHDRTRLPPKFRVDRETLKPSAEDEELWAARLAASMGGVDPHASAHLLVQLSDTFWNTKGESAYNCAVTLVHGIAPRDGLEALLAAQMVAVHNVALEQLRRARLPNQTFEGERLSISSATRLLRLFTEQMEALARYRGKASEQRVTVEHVHVHEGGQAIVGAVAAPPKPPQGEGGHGET